MDQHVKEAWDQLRQAVSVEQNVSALALGVYLVMGGLMALYLRLVYRKCGATANDADSITRVFPLLTLVTIGVISVVKSSAALSLGLVGALSIVRFRAAIKEPEELVYLFLCIGVGLALGAGQPLLALTMLLVASVFIFGMHYAKGSTQHQNLLLTVSGDADRYFSNTENGALRVIEEVVKGYTLQRFDVESGRGQVRVVVHESSPQATTEMMQRLRERLPGCELSYVNLKTTW